jgi:hypothetical protein
MAGLFYTIGYKTDKAALKSAEEQFKSFSENLKKGLEFAGVALGIKEIVSQLGEATKVASDNVKSQNLLATQLRDTTGATKEQIEAVNSSIEKMQLMSSVSSEVIRPAFAQLVRSTGDVTNATKLTNLALDVSAGTGKDLSAVAIALGKAYQGNASSLTRLGINVKGMHDPLAALTEQFKGAAEAAANSDPFARLQIIMKGLQEQIGTQLLPYLESFANYLASPQGQQDIKDFADGVGNIATSVLDLAKALNSNNFATGTAKLAEFLGLLVKGKFGDALTVINARQDELAKNIVSPEYNKQVLEMVAKGSGVAAKNAQQQLKNLAAAKKAADAVRGAAADAARYSGLEAMGKALGYNVSNPITGAVDPLAAAAAAKAAAARKAAAAKAAAAAKKEFDAQIKAMADFVSANNKLLNDAQSALTNITQSNVEFQKTLKISIVSIKNLADTAPAMGQFESQVTSAFDNITASAQQAFDNKLITQTALTQLSDYATKEQIVLQGIARQRDELANKISLAQALYSSTKDAVVSFGNITSLLKSQTQTVQQTTTEIINGISTTITKTVEIASQNDLVAEYKKIIDKTKAFATNLKALKAAGLDNNLFQQIVSAGVDAGGATAEAIIAGGGSTITELNSLFSDLQTTGSQIAETTTVMMYNNGQDVVGGFIEGLKSQDAALKDSAISMANTFANTFTSMLNAAIQTSIQAAQDAVTKAALGLGGGNPALAAYAQASIQGLSGQALSDQIDMLTGANVTAPGSFMNTLGYMSASAPAPAAPPMVVVNVGGKEIVSAIKTYERANGSVWVAA